MFTNKWFHQSNSNLESKTKSETEKVRKKKRGHCFSFVTNVFSVPPRRLLTVPQTQHRNLHVFQFCGLQFAGLEVGEAVCW